VRQNQAGQWFHISEVFLGIAQAFSVMLYCDQRPQISGAALLEALRRRCGRVEPLDSADDSHLLAYEYLDHVVQFDDQTLPVSSLTTILDSVRDSQRVIDALNQTWDWPEAREALSHCHAMVGIHEVMAQTLDYKERLALFHNIVLSVLDLVPCLAIDWLSSQQIVNPQAYIESKQPDNAPGYVLLYPAVNVRFFNIKERVKGEKLMDTLGLNALGLPDLQCHYVGLEPGEVALMLYNAAYYIYDQGDVVEDGQTIQGVGPEDKWICRHEKALAAPEREVLDIDPGLPYTHSIRD
jgi:hypothetical protein